MTDIKIAVVGCGYWGKNLVRNYAELGVLACVCDANMPAAEQASKCYNVPCCSFEEILASDVSGVVIAAPAVQHFALARAVLERGKHVFVEKPLSLKPEDARTLCQLAQHQRKVLMVGHLLQYHAAFLSLKGFVAEGSIGKLQYIYSHRLNLGKFRNEENILWSFAPHDISMILSLADEAPTRVSAIGGCYLTSQIYDITTTHLSFSNGIDAHVLVSWLHPYKEQKLIVIGSHGAMVFDDTEPWERKLQLYSHQIDLSGTVPVAAKADVQFMPVAPMEPLRNECQHFIECIRTGKMPRTDGEEGARVLAVLDRAQASLQGKF
ncbi:MAG: Gfo/Idh/MocA family oxidoreductase [Holosporales bacterium]|jgi:predicted dehydrogenase|nr:Gfo/Idh/MocA family oxidoreductase [Holosporales bacterium]